MTLRGPRLAAMLFVLPLLGCPGLGLGAQTAPASAVNAGSAAPASALPSAGAPAAGESRAQPFSIRQAAAAALEKSADLIDARAAVEAARLALELSEPWRSSTLTAKGTAASAAAPAEGTELSWSLQAAAPVATGVSLNASLSDSLASAGGTVRPFAEKDLKARENLDRALVQQTETERLALLAVRKAYRSAWLATLDRGLKEKALASAEARAETVSLNAEAGAASSTEVIDAESKRIGAMVDLLDSEDALEAALTALSRLVGRSLQAAELAAPDAGAERGPQTREEYLAASAGLAALGIDLSQARRDAKPVLPELALSGNLSKRLDKAEAPSSWSVSAAVTIDPETFLRGPDRASALALQRVARKLRESTTDTGEEYSALLARISSARQALEAATRIETTARLNYEKNSYLAEAGTVSGAALLDYEVSLLTARYRVAKASSDLGNAIDALDGRLLETAR